MPLTGIWTNELHSWMLLIEDGTNGLSGLYHSDVGRDKGWRVVAGRTHAMDSGKRMVGFAVCFEVDDPGPGNGHSSICTWSGWYRPVDDIEQIETHWHLSVNKIDRHDDWSANLIGEDLFQKITDDASEALVRDRDAIEALVEKLRQRRRP